jgi:hypothetical protein
MVFTVFQWLSMKIGGGGSHRRTRLRLAFPVSRENTGKFFDFGLTIDEAPRLSAGNTIAYDPNSLAAETGKICRRTGNFEGA